jgi:hypothetical protein
LSRLTNWQELAFFLLLLPSSLASSLLAKNCFLAQMHDDLKLQSSRSKKSPTVKNQVKDGTNDVFPFFVTLPESILLDLCTGGYSI